MPTIPSIAARSHSPAIKDFRDMTRLYLCRNPRRLLFFVHGFGGKNTKTWMKFPALILNDPRFKNDDLLFYGYKSREQAAIASSGLLYDDLEDFLTVQKHYPIDGDQGYTRPCNYERIVFIAHSLGGPVVRYMLLKAAQADAAWLNKTSLIFFAPATPGAYAERIVQMIANWSHGGTLGLMNWIFRFLWPVVDDLGIDSQFLTYVRNETHAVLEQPTYQNLRSILTVFGTFDNIIRLVPPELCCDSPYEWLPLRTHTNVCKPRMPGDDSYLCLVSALSRLG
jgi:pimeloyl-ACP methyl ester carboxylesterase